MADHSVGGTLVPGSNGGRRPRPTLEEVAAYAQVSRATVSRVINGSPRVSPEARVAVERAVQRLGYVANSAARSLVTQRTDSVGLVVSESEVRVFTDPYFGDIVRGASMELNAAGKQLVLIMVQSEGERSRVERYVAGGHVDGVLLLSLHGNDPLPTTLARVGVPTVIGGRALSDADLPYVDVDNRGGARDAVSFLIDQGRTQIATIAGPQDMCAGLDRLAGYRDALGVRRSRRSLIAYGSFTPESGERAMTELLERGPRLDAVFVASDLMAIGALRALRSAGRRVPEDVAVVGFDDLDLATMTEPALTTVRQPTAEMGRQMASLVLALAERPHAPRARGLILPTELVTRQSA
jgi:DNA-binding LacI/PurR family transcriptional regulator